MQKLKHLKTRIFTLAALTIAMQASQAALVEMAEYQDWEAVQRSISSEDVNSAQPDGMTALFWATYYDETEIVEMLLNAGASPNVANRYGMTPLIQASINGNGEIISMLLDAGADANYTTSEGDSAILNAAKTGSVQGVQALIEAGANVNYMDGYLFQTPLMWAASSNQAEIVRMLIDNGADMNTRSPVLELRGVRQGPVAGDFPDGGLTALHHAARENSIDATRVFVEKGADLDVLDPMGISPLRFAIINANLDLAKMLVEGGANINDGALVDLLDVETNTLTFLRAEKNYVNTTTVRELMDLMFDRGVDVDAYPETAYPFPATGFRGGSGTAGQTALYNAATRDNPEMLTLFLEHGADPNSVNANGKYLPLSAALKVIPVRGGNMMNDDDEEDMAEFIVSDSATILLEHGANINARADDGSSVLHHAVALGKEQVVSYLIDNGADLSLKDDSNRTALDLANGVPAVSTGDEEREPAELPVYEEIATLLTEAMNAQGISIEEYVAPVADEENEEA